MFMTACRTLKKAQEIEKMKMKQVRVPMIWATNWLAPP